MSSVSTYGSSSSAASASRSNSSLTNTPNNASPFNNNKRTPPPQSLTASPQEPTKRARLISDCSIPTTSPLDAEDKMFLDTLCNDEMFSDLDTLSLLELPLTTHHENENPSSKNEFVDMVFEYFINDTKGTTLDTTSEVPDLAAPQQMVETTFESTSEVLTNDKLQIRVPEAIAVDDIRVPQQILSHYFKASYDLPTCKRDGCGQVSCQGSNSSHCRLCMIQLGYPNPITYERPDDCQYAHDVLTSMKSDTIRKEIRESDVYKAFVKKPFNSLTSSGDEAYEQARKVNDLVHQKTGIKYPIHATFSTITKCHKRCHELIHVPIIVHLMMWSLGSLGYKRRRIRNLRAFIVELVNNEEVPRQHKFYFRAATYKDDIMKLGYKEDEVPMVAQKISIVVRATLFLLDLISFADVYGMVDVVINIFAVDKQLASLQKSEIPRLFAALNYTMNYVAQLKSNAFKEASLAVTVNASRVNMSQYIILRSCSGSLFLGLLKSLALVGFNPVFSNKADKLPHVEMLLQSTSAATLMPYLESMMRGELQYDHKQMYVAIHRPNANGSNSVWNVPLIILAFGSHLQQTAFVSSAGTSVPCFPYTMNIGSGKNRNRMRLRLRSCVESGTGAATSASAGANVAPAFEMFCINPNGDYETNFVKIMLTFFACHEKVNEIGLQKLCDDNQQAQAKQFSFNFQTHDKESREIEKQLDILHDRMTRNPSQFKNETRIRMKLVELSTMMISHSGGDKSVGAALNSACLLAGQNEDDAVNQATSLPPLPNAYEDLPIYL